MSRRRDKWVAKILAGAMLIGATGCGNSNGIDETETTVEEIDVSWSENPEEYIISLINNDREKLVNYIRRVYEKQVTGDTYSIISDTTQLDGEAMMSVEFANLCKSVLDGNFSDTEESNRNGWKDYFIEYPSGIMSDFQRENFLNGRYLNLRKMYFQIEEQLKKVIKKENLGNTVTSCLDASGEIVIGNVRNEWGKNINDGDDWYKGRSAIIPNASRKVVELVWENKDGEQVDYKSDGEEEIKKIFQTFYNSDCLSEMAAVGLFEEGLAALKLDHPEVQIFKDENTIDLGYDATPFYNFSNGDVIAMNEPQKDEYTL